MKSEVIVLNKERNVTLTAFIQDVGKEFANIAKRPAVLVIPGGGYTMCSDREAEPVAFAYLKAGYQAFILRYSVNEDAKWPNPLSDYEQAMELIRSRADQWNVYENRIAAVGFSAGGHLAACAATMAKNRPNAAILGYPVLMGEFVKLCLKDAPDVISAVDENTCPCFVFSTRTDNIVPIVNSIKFLDALTEHDISFESHIYSYGPHGFSTGDSSLLAPGTDISNRAHRWVNDSIEWLKELFGDFGNGDMTEPKYKARITDDTEDFLSIDCTLRHLMKNSKAMEAILSVLSQVGEKNAAIYGEALFSEEDLNSVYISKLKLRDILEFMEVSRENADRLNMQLRRIPNK